MEFEAVLRQIPGWPGELALFIGGEWVGPAAGRTFPTINPATGEELARVPLADAEDVDRAVTAAARAFPSWRDLPIHERAEMVANLAARLSARVDALAALDALDGGNPIRAMREDVRHAAEFLEYFAGLGREVKGEVFPTPAGTLHYTVREPYGVVGRITPFNHPLMFAAAKLAAPLIAGNTVVLKPAEQTPLSALALCADLVAVFPPGVVNVVTGDRVAGAALVAHPAVRRVALIGGLETGRAVMRAAAEGVKAVTLELGGKNPLIVCPDADLDAALAGAVQGMNFSWTQGQSCGSTSRLFLHEEIHDAFLKRLVEAVRRIRLGLPIREETEMGCLVSQEQFDKVSAYIRLGQEEGARLLTGGGRPRDPELERGFFIEPTVFAGVKTGMRIAQEEVFGPVLSVLSWRDREAVLAEANSVAYGLTASIWTRDFAQAELMARRLEAGYVWINCVSRHYVGAPFGGFKQSGVGREECLEELLSYTQVKSVRAELG